MSGSEGRGSTLPGAWSLEPGALQQQGLGHAAMDHHQNSGLQLEGFGLEKAAMGKERKEGQRRGKLMNLPYDILLEILSRLPARFLLQCRCVCKSWLTLVRDPRLAKMHLARASQHRNPSLIFNFRDNGTADLNLILNFHVNGNRVLYLFDLNEEGCEAVTIELPFLSSGSPNPFSILGSCNGLVCVARGFSLPSDPDIYIFNPITRECTMLPEPCIAHTSRADYAFGYHPATDEYKVVRTLFTGTNPLTGSYQTKVEVYTLGSKSWRRLEDTEFLLWASPSSLVNGAIHWLSGYHLGSGIYLIVYFDVGDEEFRVLDPPSELNPSREKGCASLVVLEGCLSLAYAPDDGGSLVVWVMKEYGVKESWTKQFVIQRGAVFPPMNYLQLLCLLKNGEILLEHTIKRLFCYNPNTKMVRHLAIHDLPNWIMHPTHTYVQSLVSLWTNNGAEE
ncbi:PREDICTED: F-box protein At3g07870-like [Nelumbo nucifera]|uniref:F-box domain-containing protein n=2 Tax=Nelumbo nucifera TaxID=4432 RepID=A0A822XI31_NELNU|nr:PREDICTED: F-box protein At3g07870-like [Nelumbo nucifera]DAD19353.1 TPA_asm: hypothetical protein HUJ06_020816 [Nelumbo nucifera]